MDELSEDSCGPGNFGVKFKQVDQCNYCSAMVMALCEAEYTKRQAEVAKPKPDEVLTDAARR